MPAKPLMEQYVGEPITPDTSTFDAGRMAIGEPGLPRQFTWRGEAIRISAIRRTWRETGPCRHGSGEQYVRKHWYEVEDAAGRLLKLYAVRTSRRGGKAGLWRLFSVSGASHPTP